MKAVVAIISTLCWVPLLAPYTEPCDATALLQALSNSIWALAHLKSRGMEVDALRHPDLMRFLNELAGAAQRALVRPHATLAPPGSNGLEPRLPECQRYLALVEREFSCQVGLCGCCRVLNQECVRRLCLLHLGSQRMCAASPILHIAAVCLLSNTLFVTCCVCACRRPW